MKKILKIGKLWPSYSNLNLMRFWDTMHMKVIKQLRNV